MRSFLKAVSLLSIIPTPVELNGERWGETAAFFPLVGLLFGLILLGFNSLLMRVLPRLAVDIILVFVLIALSGGLHLDGLADTVDGFVGGRTKEETLTIMRDSYLGTFGVAAIFFVLAFKFIFLYSISLPAKNAILLIFPCLGRWSMVYGAASYQYVREAGTGKTFVEQTKLRHLLVASLTVIIVAGLVLSLKAVYFLLGLFLLTGLLLLLFSRKIGGVTGDILGAMAEISEVFVLFLAVLLF